MREAKSCADRSHRMGFNLAFTQIHILAFAIKKNKFEFSSAKFPCFVCFRFFFFVQIVGLKSEHKIE